MAIALFKKQNKIVQILKNKKESAEEYHDQLPN